MKIVIYFVIDEKLLQKQGVLNFDHKDQQSTCRRPPCYKQSKNNICTLTENNWQRVILKIKF